MIKYPVSRRVLSEEGNPDSHVSGGREEKISFKQKIMCFKCVAFSTKAPLDCSPVSGLLTDGENDGNVERGVIDGNVDQTWSQIK